jgi:hypothetical protein
VTKPTTAPAASHAVAPVLSEPVQQALLNLGRALVHLARAFVDEMAARQAVAASLSGPLPAPDVDGFSVSAAAGGLFTHAPSTVPGSGVPPAPREVPFYSQHDATHVPRPGPGAAYRACRAMCQAAGVRVAAGPGDHISADTAEGLREAMSYLLGQLGQGRCVVAGVRPAGESDHFVVITGQDAGVGGPPVLRFHDPSFSNAAQGARRAMVLDQAGRPVHRAGDRHLELARVVRSQGGPRAPVQPAPPSGVDSPAVTVTYGPHARPLAPHQEAKVRALLSAAGAASATITSTQRTPADQARIMFDNVERRGVTQQRALYAAPGREVVDLCASLKAKGMPRPQVIAAMEQRIREVGPARVSRHCATGNDIVVDIAPGSVKGRRAFEAAVEAAQAEGQVRAFLHPRNSTDPAYHIEIPG